MEGKAIKAEILDQLVSLVPLNRKSEKWFPSFRYFW